MPILKVEIVESPKWVTPPSLAEMIADGVGSALGSRQGSVWVRVRTIRAEDYAENGGNPDAAPVFVTILERELPEGEALDREVERVTQAVAHACGRSDHRVHLIYEPAGRGRIAFGGRLVK